MADVPSDLKENFNRLLVLLHQIVPHHRPNADEVRQVIPMAFIRSLHTLCSLHTPFEAIG